jgi:hypothetical protein
MLGVINTVPQLLRLPLPPERVQMKNLDFYKILDADLAKIIAEHLDKKLLGKLKQDQQKKSYALLVWFLSFYSDIANVEQYITDGNDDSSCDIILDLTDSQGIKTFYVVQSKWNNESNCTGEMDSTELKSFLSDFQVVIRGERVESKNTKFNARYKDLVSHVRQNGVTKAIFLSLKNRCKTIADNIQSTKNAIGGNVEIECFDINRIKADYISKIFKEAIPPNPLNSVYSPEYERIKLSVARDDPANRNQIFLRAPFEAHVFCVKPSMIHRLVERYGVSLFEKNVRNPLKKSSINREIENTLKNNPSYFWYYNNGITAITRSIPEIGSQSHEFEVIGLQIINGAQTAYSIYNALRSCSIEQRNLIDAETRITFRLLKSGGTDFDLKVTKFTNSQNPVSDRDFWSNDPIQERIQRYFYETKVWYERRAGEFRKPPAGVDVIPNTFVASAYLAFWLSDPVGVFDAAIRRQSKKGDMIFTSHKENEKGLYERIFNDHTDSKAVFASFCMFDLLTDNNGFEPSNVFFSNGFHILAISKVILKKFLKQKFEEDVNMAEFIARRYNDEDTILLRKIISYSASLMRDEIERDKAKGKQRQALMNLITKKSHLDVLLEQVELQKLDVAAVEAVDLVIVDKDIGELEDEEVEEIEIRQSE